MVNKGQLKLLNNTAVLCEVDKNIKMTLQGHPRSPTMTSIHEVYTISYHKVEDWEES